MRTVHRQGVASKVFPKLLRFGIQPLSSSNIGLWLCNVVNLAPSIVLHVPQVHRNLCTFSVAGVYVCNGRVHCWLYVCNGRGSLLVYVCNGRVHCWYMCVMAEFIVGMCVMAEFIVGALYSEEFIVGMCNGRVHCWCSIFRRVHCWCSIFRRVHCWCSIFRRVLQLAHQWCTLMVDGKNAQSVPL
jgi:hypothetical protein